MPVSDVDVARKYVQLWQSAGRRGIEFDLSLGDVRRLLSRKYCYYTGVELVNDNTPHGERPASNSRTIDRIHSGAGYTKGNVVACTHAANQLKNYAIELPESPSYVGWGAFNKMAKVLSKHKEG